MYLQGNIVQSLMYVQGWNTDTLQFNKFDFMTQESKLLCKPNNITDTA